MSDVAPPVRRWLPCSPARGVGYLRIIDRDYVEPSNLQRQVLFDEADAAESLPKAIAAARKIAGFNSEIAVEPQVADLTPVNAEDLLGDVDLILDGTDNFETRYLINDFAVSQSLPWIYAAAVASYGVTMTILPGETACLACIFPDSPRGMVETCDTSGILNSAVNFVASIAATEAMKLVVGARDKIRRTLLSYDVWTNDFAEINTAKPRQAAAPASSAISSILPARDGPISRCADGIRCRFTNASGPSTSPSSRAA